MEMAQLFIHFTKGSADLYNPSLATFPMGVITSVIFYYLKAVTFY